MNPTDKPQITLPTKIEVTFFDKPIINQPTHRGIVDN